MAKYHVHHFLFLVEKKGESLGQRLNNTNGSIIKAIHRQSYRIPRKKEGSTSTNEISLGLNARNVTILKNVNMPQKIKNRFITHIIVFGILNFRSIRSLQKNRN